MINLFLTRRQLFLLVLGTPLATVLLFVLGVFSGAAIGAPGPLVAEPESPATENTGSAPESGRARASWLDTPAPLSTRAGDDTALPLFSPARHSGRIERKSQEPSLAEPTPERQHERSEAASAPEELYSIQAGVFTELENARKLDRILKARGLASRLEVVDGPEPASERYRVRIGLFDARAAAMAALEAQEGDTLADAFIVARPLNHS
ncbi:MULTISPECIES: SPOR domain-containing protein [Thioalkalivibrio]|uniref:SPOR domain-containing protein n=1 Tax=Thioalkalivibrio TaxID=106633 RepID=UPI0003792F88|nr:MULTISPECIES: SPOR domain-containing protein [Thioalkalivibrio]OOC50702.1 SPOR domain-containing protein [Thioalkalivibrio versutus]